MISAHWDTSRAKKTFVTAQALPKTIHDFRGFPPILSAIQYPAPGSREVAELICKTAANFNVAPDFDSWGLDHGTWSVLRHIYPDANIPTLQLSLDMSAKDLAVHFELGKALKPLRAAGVLICASGNIVHNLATIDWNEDAAPFDWAVEFDTWVKERLHARDFKSLVSTFLSSQAGRLSVPTLEHYLPMLYILGASDPNDQLSWIFEGFQNASISMRSFLFE